MRGFLDTLAHAFVKSMRHPVQQAGRLLRFLLILRQKMLTDFIYQRICSVNTAAERPGESVGFINLADEDGKRPIEKDPLWKKLSAVKNGKVYEADRFAWSLRRSIDGADALIDEIGQHLLPVFIDFIFFSRHQDNGVGVFLKQLLKRHFNIDGFTVFAIAFAAVSDTVCIADFRQKLRREKAFSRLSF